MAVQISVWHFMNKLSKSNFFPPLPGSAWFMYTAECMEMYDLVLVVMKIT